eukprot:COSAG02_NODE_214_length_28689_cov_34.895523_20_plen_95_part_00
MYINPNNLGTGCCYIYDTLQSAAVGALSLLYQVPMASSANAYAARRAIDAGACTARRRLPRARGARPAARAMRSVDSAIFAQHVVCPTVGSAYQ